jgi:hypothetical protein
MKITEKEQELNFNKWKRVFWRTKIENKSVEHITKVWLEGKYKGKYFELLITIEDDGERHYDFITEPEGYEDNENYVDDIIAVADEVEI